MKRYSSLLEESKLSPEGATWDGPEDVDDGAGDGSPGQHREITRILLELNPVVKLLDNKHQLSVNPAERLIITHPQMISRLTAGSPFFKDGSVLAGENPEFRIVDYETRPDLTLGNTKSEDRADAEASVALARMRRRECRKAEAQLKKKLFNHLAESRRRVNHVKIGKSDPYGNRDSVYSTQMIEDAHSPQGAERKRYVTHSLGEALKAGNLQALLQSPTPSGGSGAEPRQTPSGGQRREKGTPEKARAVSIVSALEDSVVLPPLIHTDSLVQSESGFAGLKRRSSFFATQPEEALAVNTTESGPNASDDAGSTPMGRKAKTTLSIIHRNRSQSVVSGGTVSTPMHRSASMLELSTSLSREFLPSPRKKASLKLEKFSGRAEALFLDYKDTPAATVLARNYRRGDDVNKRKQNKQASRLLAHYRFVIEQGGAQVDATSRATQKIDRLSSERKAKYWKRFSAMNVRKPLPIRGTMAEILNTVRQATGVAFDNGMRIEEFARECKEFSRLEAYCHESYTHPLVFQMLSAAKGFLSLERAPRPEQFHNKIVMKLAPTDLMFNDVTSTVVHIAKMCGVSRADAIDAIRQKAHNFVVDRSEEMRRNLSTTPSAGLQADPSASHRRTTYNRW